VVDGDVKIDGAAAYGAVFNVFLNLDRTVDDYLNPFATVGAGDRDYF